MNGFFKKAMRGEIFFEPISLAISSFLFVNAGFAVGTAIFIGNAVVAVLTIGALVGVSIATRSILGRAASGGAGAGGRFFSDCGGKSNAISPGAGNIKEGYLWGNKSFRADRIY